MNTTLQDWNSCNEARWVDKARNVNSALFKELEQNGFCKSFMYDALSDLQLQALGSELGEVLARTVTIHDVLGFKELINSSASFADKKRKRVNVCSLDLWQFGGKVEKKLLTERERLSVKLNIKAKTPGHSFPTATAKPIESKEDKRRRYAHRIGMVLIECEFPAAGLISSSLAPERLMNRFAGGKRVGTLQGKLSGFEAMKIWMQQNYGKVFPSREIELIDYVLDKASEPCGPSVPGTILSTVGFFETIGGRPASDRVSSASAVKAIVSEVQLGLTAAHPKIKRKAHQFPSSMVAAWEIMICDKDIYDVVRLTIWEQLIMVWASLRTGDTSGTHQDGLTMVLGTLHGEITCSKTTGAGKLVGMVKFNISPDAWLVMPGWLEEGWDLFVKHRSGLSFMLALPLADFTGFSSQEPTFAQRTAAMRKLILDTGRPVYKDAEQNGFGVWSMSPPDFMLLGSQTFWSGHSARCTVPTWAAALQYTKEERNYLGRWCPSESDEYVRNAEAISCRIQGAVATRMRSKFTTDVFHESPLLRELAQYCIARGYEEEEVELMTTSLLQKGFELPGIGVSGGEGDDVSCENPESFPEDFDPTLDVDLLETQADFPLGQLIVSIDKAGTAMTLHRLGACWRIPGVHYRTYMAVEEDGNEEGCCNNLCKECWPHKLVSKLAIDMTSESSSSSSSSDSD